MSKRTNKSNHHNKQMHTEGGGQNPLPLQHKYHISFRMLMYFFYKINN